MTEEQTCRTCRFNDLDKCRRWPPRVEMQLTSTLQTQSGQYVNGQWVVPPQQIVPSSFPVTLWPIVFAHEWCGEWKIRPYEAPPEPGRKLDLEVKDQQR